MNLELSLEDPEKRQDLLQKVLTSIPIRIVDGKMNLYAQGIPDVDASLSLHEGEEKIRSYMRACKYTTVMPYTSASFDVVSGRINFSRDCAKINFPEGISPELQKEILQAFLEGGRIERIHIDHLSCIEPGQIEKHPLNTFLNASYDIVDMDLWTSSYKASEMNGGGRGKGSGIKMTFWGKPALELRVGRDLERREETLLQEWFWNLK